MLRETVIKVEKLRIMLQKLEKVGVSLKTRQLSSLYR